MASPKFTIGHHGSENSLRHVIGRSGTPDVRFAHY